MKKKTISGTHLHHLIEIKTSLVQVFRRISNCILCHCFKLRGVIENVKNVYVLGFFFFSVSVSILSSCWKYLLFLVKCIWHFHEIGPDIYFLVSMLFPLKWQLTIKFNSIEDARIQQEPFQWKKKKFNRNSRETNIGVEKNHKKFEIICHKIGDSCSDWKCLYVD